MLQSHIIRGSKHNQIPHERKAQIIEIYANNHRGETIAKFRDLLTTDYGYTHSASWITETLEGAGLYQRKYYPL